MSSPLLIDNTNKLLKIFVNNWKSYVVLNSKWDKSIKVSKYYWSHSLCLCGILNSYSNIHFIKFVCVKILNVLLFWFLNWNSLFSILVFIFDIQKICNKFHLSSYITQMHFYQNLNATPSFPFQMSQFQTVLLKLINCNNISFKKERKHK